MTCWEDKTPSPTCRICDAPAVPGSYLCDRCRRLRDRPETRPGARVDVAARLRAMHTQWSAEEGAFRCYYTGLALTEGYGDPRFATWEHREPGDEASVVLVADLVNRMKTDLREREFIAMVRALARRFDGHPFDVTAFPTRPLPTRAPVDPPTSA